MLEQQDACAAEEGKLIRSSSDKQQLPPHGVSMSPCGGIGYCLHQERLNWKFIYLLIMKEKRTVEIG